MAMCLPSSQVARSQSAHPSNFGGNVARLYRTAMLGVQDAGWTPAGRYLRLIYVVAALISGGNSDLASSTLNQHI